MSRSKEKTVINEPIKKADPFDLSKTDPSLLDGAVKWPDPRFSTKRRDAFNAYFHPTKVAGGELVKKIRIPILSFGGELLFYLEVDQKIQDYYLDKLKQVGDL